MSLLTSCSWTLRGSGGGGGVTMESANLPIKIQSKGSYTHANWIAIQICGQPALTPDHSALQLEKTQNTHAGTVDTCLYHLVLPPF